MSTANKMDELLSLLPQVKALHSDWFKKRRDKILNLSESIKHIPKQKSSHRFTPNDTE